MEQSEETRTGTMVKENTETEGGYIDEAWHGNREAGACSRGMSWEYS